MTRIRGTKEAKLRPQSALPLPRAQAQTTVPAGAALRERAQAIAEQSQSQPQDLQEGLLPEQAQRTLHELRVHQIELQLQNEELRQSQLKLDVERARYFDLYDMAPVGYCTVSESGLILEANLTASVLLGLARRAMFHQPLSRFIAPADQDTWYLCRKQLLESAATRECEVQMVQEDGQLVWVKLVATAMGEGETARVIRLVITDISQRRFIESELARTRSELMTAQRAAHIGNWNWNLTSDVHVWSDELHVIYGQPLALGPVPYPEVKRYFSTDDWTVLNAAIEKCLSDGMPYQCDVQVQRADGGRSWVDIFGSAVRNGAGAITGLHGTLQDITDRKAADLARQAAVDLLQKIANRVPGMVYQYRLRSDGSSCFPFASEAIREIYRVSPEEVREDASKVFAVVHPDDYAAGVASIAASASQLTLWQHEYRVKFDDGTVNWLLANAVPQREPDGSVLWHGFITDISARKQVELELRESVQALRISERQMAIAQKISATGSWTYNLATGSIWGSAEGLLMFGYPALAREFPLEEIEACIPERVRVHQTLLALINEGSDYDLEFSINPADGSASRLVHSLATLEHDELGKPALVLGFVQDITERKRIAAALGASEARFRQIVNEAPLGIALIDSLSGQIHSVNSMFARIAGRSMEEMICIDWMTLTHPDDLQKDLEQMALFNSGEISGFKMEKRYLHHDGSAVWISMTIASIEVEDKTQPRHLCMIEDISLRKQMEEQVRLLAYFDPLTRLANRRLLNDRLNQAILTGKRSGRFAALMLLDLDNFKPLNDQQGHAMGDLLLMEVALRLKSCAREMDTVARIGGDEFVVLLGELPTDRTQALHQAALVAEKIRSSLAEPYILQSGTVTHSCTASIGVELFLGEESGEEELLKRADAAMYQAKENGRNRVQFHEK